MKEEHAMENYDVYLPSNEEKPEPIFESYYGKLPEFEMIENLFEGIISKGRKEKNKANPNKYSENKEVCKILKKVFGFKDAFLYWIPSNSVNAYTVTVHSLMIFGESKDFIEKRSDKGFYDNSHRSVLTVYLYTGILDEKVDLTPAELLSIVLHEIGHNFDYSPYHTITFFIDSILTMGEYSVYVANNKKTVNKVIYCVLALLLGWIGAHKFYAGKVAAGILYLLFFWTCIPAIIAFIEFILALCKTEDSNGNILV